MTSQSKLARLTGWSLLAFAFAIPWSSALYRLSIFALLVCCIVFLTTDLKKIYSGKAEFSISKASHYVPIIFPWILTAWIMLTGFWTTGTSDLYSFDVSRYIKLLMIPIFALLIARFYGGRQTEIINAFACGVIVLMIPSYLDFLGVFRLLGIDAVKLGNHSYQAATERGLNLVYWRNQIVHGFHVSFLFSLVLLTLPEQGWRRYLHWLLAIACVFDVIFLITGRMALVSLLASGATLIFIAVPSRRARVQLAAAIFIASIIIIALNSGVQTRIMSVWIEFTEYLIHANIQTSSGSRLHYWSISLDLFQQHPIIGAGAGSFREWLLTHRDPLSKQSHFHAHNEYITQLSQFGLIGFGLFLFMIKYILKALRACSDQRVRGSILVAVVIFCVNALSDSSLHNEWEGWTLVLFSGLAGSYLFDQSKV